MGINFLLKIQKAILKASQFLYKYYFAKQY